MGQKTSSPAPLSTSDGSLQWLATAIRAPPVCPSVGVKGDQALQPCPVCHTVRTVLVFMSSCLCPGTSLPCNVTSHPCQPESLWGLCSEAFPVPVDQEEPPPHLPCAAPFKVFSAPSLLLPWRSSLSLSAEAPAPEGWGPHFWWRGVPLCGLRGT